MTKRPVRERLVTLRLNRAETALVRRHLDRPESVGQAVRRMALAYAQQWEPVRCAVCRTDMGDEPSYAEDENICLSCVQNMALHGAALPLE